MAALPDGGGGSLNLGGPLGAKDDIRTQFATREGIYHVVTAPPEYARTALRYPVNGGQTGNVPVRLSFAIAPRGSGQASINSAPSGGGGGPWPQGGVDHSVGGRTNHDGSYFGSAGSAGRVVNRTGGRQGNAVNSHADHGGVSGPPPDADEVIGFSVGKELYVYQFSGALRPITSCQLLEKKVYRGPQPTCHDFNDATATADRLQMLVGFNLGQIQLIDVMANEESKLFNEERQVDSTRVTCVRWVPGAPSHFVAAHVSGHIYVYDEQLAAPSAALLSGAGGSGGNTSVSASSGSIGTGGGSTGAPVYQVFKQGAGFSVHTCKAGKGSAGSARRNPVYRWTVEGGCRGVNDLVFSPCARYLAVAAQDGYLHVFNYDHQELVGSMKSYFGGLRCAAWSPDGRYVVTGGEDDLITVWSLAEKRVVCRGKGHRSWVSAVAFDPYMSRTATPPSFAPSSPSPPPRLSPADRRGTQYPPPPPYSKPSPNGSASTPGGGGRPPTRPSSPPNQGAAEPPSYRIGSVGDDALLCLWDLTEDVLKRHHNVVATATTRNRTSSVVAATEGGASSLRATVVNGSSRPGDRLLTSSSESSGLASRFASLSAASDSGGVAKTRGDVTMTTVSSKRSTNSLGGVAGTRLATSGGAGSDASTVLGRSGGGGKSGDSVSSAGAKSNKPGGEEGALRLLGTVACPRITEVPVIEALTAKRVSRDRLTAVAFRSDCLVTACQDGGVLTWARPPPEGEGARL